MTKSDASNDSRDIFINQNLGLEDAADLFSANQIPEGASGQGVLLTADGNEFHGELFGANGIGEGELVFTTGMMGYQRIPYRPFICRSSFDFHVSINR